MALTVVVAVEEVLEILVGTLLVQQRVTAGLQLYKARQRGVR